MTSTIAIIVGAFLFLFIVLGLVMKCRRCGSNSDSGYIPGVMDGSIPDKHHHSDGHGHHGDVGGHSGGHFDGGHSGGFGDSGGGSHSAH
jgi:hypothetical protein